MALAGAMVFTNRIDANTPPAGWTESPETDTFLWGKDDQLVAHNLPFEMTMIARSSSSGFRTETNFFVAYALWLQGWIAPSGLLSQNIVGYVKLPALVPCEPAEADGSPEELIASYEMFPDPEIVEMGGDFLRYFWPSSNTVVIEASYDLESWSDVVQMVGHGGTTTWNSAQSLDVFGSYFRIGLIAMRALSDNQALPLSDSRSTAYVFQRWTPEGMIVSGPGGDRLLPTEGKHSGFWCLPILLAP